MKLLIITLFLVSGVASAKTEEKKKPAAKQKKITLFNIEGDSSEKTSNLVLSFNRELPSPELKLEAHGSFIQLKLPNTFVPGSGEFIDLKSPYFTKAVAFQSGSDQGALRIFVKGQAADYLKASAADVLGKQVIVTLDHQTLNSGDKVVALPAKPKAEKSEKDRAAAMAGITSIDSKLKGKMTAVSIFCVIMILGLVGLYFFRPFIRKRFQRKRIASGSTMETLAVHALSPKQKLALVDVGGEKILLGLSSESINYIKTVGEKQQAVYSPVAAAHMAPQAPMQARQQPSARAEENRKKVQAKAAQHKSRPTTRKKAPATKQSPAEKILQREVQNEETGVNLQLSKTRALTKKTEPQTNSVEDIKKMIRQKLKQMPQIS